jgi:hypothetical protein
MKLQKLGGYASIIVVCAMLILIGIMISTAQRLGLSEPGASSDPVKVMAAYSTSPFIFHVVALLVIVIGILLLLVALALCERMQAKMPNLMRLAIIAASVSFALYATLAIASIHSNPLLVKANDASAYRAFMVLTGSIEAAAGNVWSWLILLFGWAAIKTRALPQILSWILLALGVLDILQLIFRFTMPQTLGYVVGVIGLISMVWLGVVLLRKPEPIPAQT